MIDIIKIFDMKTGKTVKTFPATNASYTLGYNDDAGSITAETTSEFICASECRPWKHGIAFVSNGPDSRTLCAGPIIDRTYTPTDGKVSISGTGPWALFQKRILWKNSVMGQAENGVSIEAKNDTNNTNGDFLVYNAGSASGCIWNLTKNLYWDSTREFHPLLTMDLSRSIGQRHERNYNILDYNYIGDLIKNLLELEDAPFLYFTFMQGWKSAYPKANMFEGHFQYKDECPVRTLNVGEPVYNVTSWSVKEDAADTRNRAFFKSSRNDKETDLYARADSTALQDDIGYSIDTVDTSHNDISIPATIKNYAALAAHSTNALTMTVECIPQIDITGWHPSDTLRLYVSDDFYETDFFEGTIKTITADTSGKFTFEVVNVSAGTQADNTKQPVTQRSLIQSVKALEAKQRASI